MKYDVIVIGAGHAGVEAAWAASRRGLHVAICTLSKETVALMPCNPAIGGTAKGHLVREIDALDGLMGRAIDATGIQFKLLNRSRGPAVWSPRAQADKRRYGQWVRQTLEATAGIDWILGTASRPLVEHGRVVGLALEDGRSFGCDALVVTTGTFLNGLVHVGREQRPAGRAGEPPSRELAESIKSLGFRWGRLKTGTPPRLHRRSIDFDTAIARGAFTEDRGDDQPVSFSFLTRGLNRPRVACWQLHTNDRVRALVLKHLDASPLFNGQIRGIGPRYCPSLEDKIVRFPERERHLLFLEPEGLDADEIYVNGFSMSLPPDVQRDIVRSLRGLEDAEMIRPGYAVEYRLRPADGADCRTRDTSRPGAVLRRPGERHVRVRRGRGAGSGCRRECGQPGEGRGALHACTSRGIHRCFGRRPNHKRVSRAIPDVYLESRTSVAPSYRQRRSQVDAARPIRWAGGGGTVAGIRGTKRQVRAQPRCDLGCGAPGQGGAATSPQGSSRAGRQPGDTRIDWRARSGVRPRRARHRPLEPCNDLALRRVFEAAGVRGGATSDTRGAPYSGVVQLRWRGRAVPRGGAATR